MTTKYSEQAKEKVVAFIFGYFYSDSQKRLIRMIASKCRQYHCKAMLFSSISDFYQNDLNDAGEQKIFETIEVERFDAIVLMAETFKREVGQTELMRRAKESGIPVYSVERPFEGGVNLSFNTVDAFREIVKHMVEKHGYRTINFLAGTKHNLFSEERLLAFREVLEENGIPFEERRVYYGDFWEQPTLAVMEQMLRDELPMPEAIVCANDTMAITACSFLKAHGYRIPEDIAVSGFDGLDAERFNQPRLLTSSYDVNELGDFLFSMICHENVTPGDYVAPVYRKLQLGGSCGCAGLEAAPAASEMILLKTEINIQQNTQFRLGQMVANYGSAVSIGEMLRAVPNYMDALYYREFWFCANEDLLEDLDLSRKNRGYEYVPQHPDFTKTMEVLHYSNHEDGTDISYDEMIAFGEIVPHLAEVLAKNDCLLLQAVHIKGKPVGYAVVSFDADQFAFSNYASFLTYFRFLLETQKTQLMLRRVFYCDSLTGLYNRNGFYEKIRPILEAAKGMEFSIISIDLDKFKQINDTYGHAEGDEALKIIGKLISQSIRHEVASRVGGDEFIIAAAGTNLEPQMQAIVTRLRERLTAYNEQGEKPYRLLASIGVYTAPLKNHTLDYFLRKADHLMYQRKQLHKLAEQQENKIQS